VVLFVAVNGKSVYMTIANNTPGEVCQWLEHLRCRSGDEIVRLRKLWHTDTPSVQGIWTPFTHLDPHLALTSFPDEKLSRRTGPESATEYVMKMAQNIKMISDDTTEKFVSDESDKDTCST